MKSRLKYYGKVIIFILISFIFSSTVFAGEAGVINEQINLLNNKTDKQTNYFLYPVFFFRKYLSGADGDRCRMYPSCSTYCVEAFKKHGPLLGWIMTCDRLLRCGRDEIYLSTPVWVNGKKRFHDPVSNNDFWW
jgi:putative component of membrane protein insertase Oxa1/YidC/SpoIIIJ protein YidD